MSHLSFRTLRSWTPFAAVIAVSALPAACAFNTHGTEEGGGGVATTTTTTSATTTSSTMTPCTPGAPQACYTGFPGTDGNGNCHAGTQTCKPDGTGYGPCMGEQVPGPAEVCDTAEDDNCNGMINEGCDCNPGDMQKCYTGAGSTKNIGICKEGMQTCGPDHMWGPCTGEILPGVEDCATPEDENCNGLVFDDAMALCVCEPTTAGACDTGKPGACAVGARVCEADGKGYGACSDTVQPKFDDCTTAADDDCDGKAIATCSGAPSQSWNTSTSFDDVAFAVAVDGNGGFVIGGVTSGIVNGFEVTGGKLLLAKYDANGAMPWQKVLGAGGYSVVRSVAVDPNGNVFAVGEFMGTLDFGGGKSITSNGGGNDIDVFLVKLNAAGAPQWIKRYGANSKTQVGYGLAADAAGNVYITGTYEGGIDFGGGGTCHPPDANAFDVFVAKINGSGTCQWAKKVGDGSDQVGTGVAVTPQGDVVVAGYFEVTADFGNGAMTSAGKADAFVAKLAANDGSAIWSKQFGDDEEQTAAAVAVDPTGDIAITGTFWKTIDLGNGALINGSNATDDVFVAKLAGTTGNAIWSKRFGDNDDQFPSRVAVDGAGNVVVIGSFWSAINFGAGNLTNSDPVNLTTDVFVAKLAATNGAHLWSQRYGDSTEQRGRDVAIDDKGNAFIVGGYQGSVTFGATPLASAGGYDAFAAKLDP